MADFLRKAKQLEFLISVLSSPPPVLPANGTPADDVDPELDELEKELQEANAEYLDALGEAGECRHWV